MEKQGHDRYFSTGPRTKCEATQVNKYLKKI